MSLEMSKQIFVYFNNKRYSTTKKRFAELVGDTVRKALKKDFVLRNQVASSSTESQYFYITKGKELSVIRVSSHNPNSYIYKNTVFFTNWYKDFGEMRKDIGKKIDIKWDKTSETLEYLDFVCLRLMELARKFNWKIYRNVNGLYRVKDSSNKKVIDIKNTRFLKGMNKLIKLNLVSIKHKSLHEKLIFYSRVSEPFSHNYKAVYKDNSKNCCLIDPLTFTVTDVFNLIFSSNPLQTAKSLSYTRQNRLTESQEKIQYNLLQSKRPYSIAENVIQGKFAKSKQLYYWKIPWKFRGKIIKNMRVRVRVGKSSIKIVTVKKVTILSDERADSFKDVVQIIKKRG